MCSGEYVDDDLHVAVRLGDLDAAKEALENGCNPNDIGLFEWNSLHEAAVNGDRNILQFLLDNGGNPNKQDKLNNNTPLHYACIEGHELCIEILIKNGGDMYIQNKEGKNCISLVTHSSALNSLKKLGYKEQYTKKGVNKNKMSMHSNNKPSKSINMNKDEQKKSTNKNKDETSVKKTLSPDVKKQMAWQEVKSQGYGSMSSLNSSTCSAADDSAGTFNLSFQYNSKNQVFKVRVWEIVLTTLLDASHISKDVALHLFVKTAILPNDQYQPIPSLKRKSETVLLKPGTHSYNEKHCASNVSWTRREAKMEFKNSLIIEYDNVEKDAAGNSTIQLSLCVRLKAGLLSNKNKNQTPVVAGLHLKMSEAIKTIMKTEFRTERYDIPGITCQSIPLDNVISGETNSAYYSDPNARCDISSTSDYAVNRSASDGDLQNIHVHQYSNSSSFVDLSSQEDVNTPSTLESVDSHSANVNSHVKVNIPRHSAVDKLQIVKVNKRTDEKMCNQGNVKIEMKSLNKLHPKHKILPKSYHHHNKTSVNHNKETSLNEGIMSKKILDEECLLGSPSEGSIPVNQRINSPQKPSSNLFTQIDESWSPSRTRKRITANSPTLNRANNSKTPTNRTFYATSRLIYDDDTNQNEAYSVHNPCFIDDEVNSHDS